jgi:hypothetical protein
MAQRAGPGLNDGRRRGRRNLGLLVVGIVAAALLLPGLSTRNAVPAADLGTPVSSEPSVLAPVTSPALAEGQISTTAPTVDPTATPPIETPTPAADPTATAKPKPTAARPAKPAPTTPAKARATPKPTPRPARTPPPATAGSTVPASVDDDCGSNVSPELNDWIASKPDGSTLVFPSGSCYRLGGDAGLNLKGRDGLTLVGTGSTLQLRTTGESNFSSAFFLQDSDHITIRGFKVDGGNTKTGTTGAASAIDEHINGAAVRAGSSHIEFDRVKWDRLRGFGVFISDDGGSTWPSNISIHDSTIQGGEMGIAIVAGRHIDIVRNHIRDSVYIAIDLEPDTAGHGFEDVLIKNNQVTRYAWGQNLTSWFVAANPSDSVVDSSTMDGLTITGNTVNIGAATANNGNADGIGGLGIRADKSNLKRNVVITNNTTTDNDTQSSSHGVIYLANVQNLTITGNRQPISNGAAFVRDSGTTGTRVVRGNDIS